MDPTKKVDAGDGRSVYYNPFVYKLRKEPTEADAQTQGQYDSLLTDEERQVSNDIQKTFNERMTDFDDFLNKEYMAFSYKINRCLKNRCYDDIYRDRLVIKDCAAACNAGLPKADRFVENMLGQIRGDFADCMNLAQNGNKNIMQETFQCYDKMIKSIKVAKQEIKKEFSYYQQRIYTQRVRQCESCSFIFCIFSLVLSFDDCSLSLSSLYNISTIYKTKRTKADGRALCVHSLLGRQRKEGERHYEQQQGAIREASRKIFIEAIAGRCRD
eukprot:TRINITY_DN1279_c0_g1_i9.p1 TRINITY_DN1279_c0_g1~~TRINITY_DN1279_c0_g1_i9.p1  ORF type:complete len:271 (+),score=43.61 TRINITY_DN1279_c0_g1_i9:109-921(+)